MKIFSTLTVHLILFVLNVISLTISFRTPSDSTGQKVLKVVLMVLAIAYAIWILSEIGVL